MMDVATAAVRVAHEAQGGDETDEERDIPTLELRSPTGRAESGAGRRDSRERPGGGRERPARSFARTERGDRESRGDREPSAERRPPRGRPRGDVDATRLYIGIGRSGGVRPADIVGAIANEAGVDSRAIGAIDIADRFSLVEVPGAAAEDIIRALRGTTLRGRKVLVRRDRET